MKATTKEKFKLFHYTTVTSHSAIGKEKIVIHNLSR